MDPCKIMLYTFIVEIVNYYSIIFLNFTNLCSREATTQYITNTLLHINDGPVLVTKGIDPMFSPSAGRPHFQPDKGLGNGQISQAKLTRQHLYKDCNFINN